MDYIEIVSEDQLAEIDAFSSSSANGALIFKHSTRCAISQMALSRFKRGWDKAKDYLPIYYLDLIRHRNISNLIAEHYVIRHESPQILWIKGGKCQYSTSHHGISPSELERVINE